MSLKLLKTLPRKREAMLSSTSGQKVKQEVMKMLQSLNEEDGKTIVIVTHDPEVAAATKRIVTFRDGRIIEDRPNDRVMQTGSQQAETE